MRISDFSTQLLFTTVPIWTTNSTESGSGTGFIFSYNPPQLPGQSVPLLVTANHVILHADRIFVDFHRKKNGAPDVGQSVRIELNKSQFLIDKTFDLAILPIQPLITQLETQGTSIFFRSLDQNLIPIDQAWEDLAAIETVTFIGYPSGTFDLHNQFPITRKGISSTPIWSDFNGQPCFLIDAGAFPGSSGSPVLILNQGEYPLPNGNIAIGNRLHFIGILLESFIQGKKESPIFIGLGKVLNAKKFILSIGELINRSLPAVHVSG